MHQGNVTHIAVVQVFGHISNETESWEATRSRAFANREDAVAWVTERLVWAHGPENVVVQDIYNEITHVTCPEDGPTHGYIMAV